MLLLMLVKWAIWSFALGSGTSGGVLAPLLMLGASLGGLAGLVLPYEGPGFWPLIAIAMLGLAENAINIRAQVQSKRGPPTLPT